VPIQCKFAFSTSFHVKIAFPVSVHGNLTTGLIELYHDASKTLNCSIELLQCFTRTALFCGKSGAGFEGPVSQAVSQPSLAVHE
jgi:hypothetical protein